MNIEQIRELISDQRRTLTKIEAMEAIVFFMQDSDTKVRYIDDFIFFSYQAFEVKDGNVMDDLHLCNQKYIANISTKPELRRRHLPYLYLKEIEYYDLVGSFSECIRCINKIMDLDEVPDFCMASVLSKAVEIFMNCGLSKEAEHYVEALRSFVNICDITNESLIILDCNLMQAYAFMGRRKEYEYHRRNLSKYSEKDFTPGVKSLVRLYILGSEATIDYSREPSQVYIDEFVDLMENCHFSSDLSAGYSEVVTPIIKWVKDYVPIEKIIRYTLKMIECSESLSDKLDMYGVLVEDFKVERPKYAFIHEEYYSTLRKYYQNDCEIHRHEVVGEMMSYEVEKQYRKKALTDELTGAGNRAAYEAELDNIKNEAAGGKILSSLTVIAMDINGLKAVNDNHGHQAGDNYIRGAALCAANALGNYGHVFRIGGDEINALILADHFPAEEIIQVIRKNCSEWTDEFGSDLSMSIGYAKWSEHPDKAIDELISIADEHMYRDKDLYYKTSGKDRRKR